MIIASCYCINFLEACPLQLNARAKPAEREIEGDGCSVSETGARNGPIKAGPWAVWEEQEAAAEIAP